MKKVLSFVGCALFVAAMTVSCNSNTENTDTIDSNAVEAVVEEEAAAPAEEVAAPADNSAREAAIAEAAEKICNCASGDKSKLQECMKSVISSCDTILGSEAFRLPWAISSADLAKRANGLVTRFKI